MAIELNWTNSREYSSIRIYRSEKRIDLASLPNRLTELAGDVTRFSDVTARVNKVYNYRIGKVSSDDGIERFSENQNFGNYPDMGHGLETIVKGDWSRGYCGRLTQTEFFTAAEVCAPLQNRVDLVIPYANPSMEWHKFIYDGKVLYFPSSSLTYAGSSSTILRSYDWELLYTAGAVFGEDGVGFFPEENIERTHNTFKPTPQDLTITKHGKTYRIRLPRLFNTDVKRYPTLGEDFYLNRFDGVSNSLDMMDSEFMLFSSAYTNAFLPPNKRRNANSIIPTGYFSAYGGRFVKVIGQELIRTNDGLRAVHGTLGGDYTDVGVVNPVIRPSAVSTSHHAVSENSLSEWRPVLELIYNEE